MAIAVVTTTVLIVGLGYFSALWFDRVLGPMIRGKGLDVLFLPGAAALTVGVPFAWKFLFDWIYDRVERWLQR